tara:strand:- start:1428 stop:1607 length:180 start_codon:yes stop_codon:yes gene_type:complete
VGDKLRLLVETFKDGKVRVFRDRSLVGIPRWIVEDKINNSTTIYNKLWYKWTDIRKIYE